mmetsp:Transcript_54469/g.130106  ORF Transcript_54469/g.130106 Transcript_54469/m.130106 type:complete len:249 (-) Transcript_54469:778-1524(-)
MGPSRHHIRVDGGEVQGCHAVSRPDHPLGVGGIFQGPEQDQPTWVDGHWGGVPIRHRQQVLVVAVPLRAGHRHALRQLRGVKAEEVLQRRLVHILLLIHILQQLIASIFSAVALLWHHRAHRHFRSILLSFDGCLESARACRTQAKCFLHADLVQSGKFLERGVVPVDHVLSMEHVLRDNALHHTQGLGHLIGDGMLSAYLPRDLVAGWLLLGGFHLLPGHKLRDFSRCGFWCGCASRISALSGGPGA